MTDDPTIAPDLQLLIKITESEARIAQFESAIHEEEREQRELKNKLQSLRRKQDGQT